MLDKLRDHIVTYLSQRQVGILSTTGSEGARAIPVHYVSQGLTVHCLIPGWCDAVYHLEQDPRVILVIQDEPSRTAPALRWLQILGAAQIVEPTEQEIARFPDQASQIAQGLYLIASISPRRIDLIDESRGWGARETLDF
jgi:nitroimidazol reductase NimA-like FMN-containing flavoprotein (pyridoxamine 5'-phosphate oxidase superfamily)